VCSGGDQGSGLVHSPRALDGDLQTQNGQKEARSMQIGCLIIASAPVLYKSKNVNCELKASSDEVRYDLTRFDPIMPIQSACGRKSVFLRYARVSLMVGLL
jgi:hypothetical protein